MAGKKAIGSPFQRRVELELQLVSTHDFDLAPQAEDLLRVLKGHSGDWDVKPEITRSMIEIGTSIQRQHSVLLAELRDLRDQLSRGARKLNIGIAGAGTHAYQHWSQQKIFPGERFHYISELYGYLAKQFTVFGQHVHVGCEDGDRVLWLLHALSRYVPHFIALSASSPYVQGQDTGFDSARLNSVFAFPLSGRAPFVHSWEQTATQSPCSVRFRHRGSGLRDDGGTMIGTGVGSLAGDAGAGAMIGGGIGMLIDMRTD